jgi:hypothetical protein
MDPDTVELIRSLVSAGGWPINPQTRGVEKDEHGQSRRVRDGAARMGDAPNLVLLGVLMNGGVAT